MFLFPSGYFDPTSAVLELPPALKNSLAILETVRHNMIAMMTYNFKSLFSAFVHVACRCANRSRRSNNESGSHGLFNFQNAIPHFAPGEPNEGWTADTYPLWRSRRLLRCHPSKPIQAFCLRSPNI